MQPVEAMFCG